MPDVTAADRVKAFLDTLGGPLHVVVTDRAALTSADLRALIEIADQARYVTAPLEGCADGDRSCPEYLDPAGEPRDDVQWCSHVTQTAATYADVLARVRLEQIIADVRGVLALAPEAAEPWEDALATDITTQLGDLAQELEDVGDAGGGVIPGSPENAQLRAELAIAERSLAQLIGAGLPCALCGGEVPAGKAYCDPPCQPKVAARTPVVAS